MLAHLVGVWRLPIGSAGAGQPIDDPVQLRERGADRRWVDEMFQRGPGVQAVFVSDAGVRVVQRRELAFSEPTLGLQLEMPQVRTVRE
jgi:hypothetical protein